ncbi:hypothetical protein BH09MYX1_BH09MYX1_16500 [soil metagenome]
MEHVKNRKHLTPGAGMPAAGGAHAMRRGGARHEVSERILLLGPNLKSREGWALNVSRGGVRAILEERVELGEEYEVTVGDGSESPLSRRGRVVWVQEEPDGCIAGFEFIYPPSGAHPAVKAPEPKE